MNRTRQSLRRRRPTLVAVAALLLTLTGLSPGSGGTAAAAEARHANGGPILPVTACADLATDGTTASDLSAVPDAPTRITSATVVEATATVPAYCFVKGYVAPQVNFELKLPLSTWKGRYLQQGCGGLCGYISATTFPTAPDPVCEAQASGDFALAATDDGHTSPGPFSAEGWGQDQQLRIDFGYRAVHVVSVAAEAVMKEYYGTPPRYSYFNGCSDGGREGLMEAQRYPEDFDGIIAGAPAAYMPFLASEHTAWVARANTGADGSPVLTADKLPGLHSAVLTACDGDDGLVDDQIDDPRTCDFDPASIQCPAGVDRTDCLTPAQVTAARKLYAPPTDENGQLLYPGREEPGSEISWAGPPIPWITAPSGVPTFAPVTADNYLRYLAFPVGQPGVPLTDWEFTSQNFAKLLPEQRTIAGLDPDLSEFRDAGGKLILYHGWADTLIPPTGTTNYYRAVQDTMGGPAATNRFARLFMFPGLYHCTGGGPGPDNSDLVHQLVGWTERGAAPQKIIATRADANGNATRTRPVYPYPIVARYKGTGSIDDAANFAPAPPATRPDDHVDWLGNDLLK
ncbi:tannase/feruloyl esterase family alpha/beta hydrolase [Streptomyces sp. NPDC058256]|uniref:tannase/feruloyl esterase family alpha/beta hydrolase n=1 Tax=Streptomyces sp. NPDC058256 TaxID=3346408 RepID=UPI0036E6C0CB